MRTPFVTAMFAAVLLTVSATTARAEDVGRINVPFSFKVNGRTLPPGRYDVRIDDDDPAVVMLNGIKGTKDHAIVATLPDYRRAREGRPSLTFTRRGDAYELSVVRESRDYARDVITR